MSELSWVEDVEVIREVVCLSPLSFYSNFSLKVAEWTFNITLQVVILFVVFIEALVVIFRGTTTNHLRFTRALRPIFFMVIVHLYIVLG